MFWYKRQLVLVMAGIFMCSSSVFAARGHAPIKGTSGESKIEGDIFFNEENGGLTVEAKVVNVAPGNYGFHVHENGSCDDTGKAAGGHFNPNHVEHGYLPKNGILHAHAGDMGNITVGEDRTGVSNIFLPGLTLTNGIYAVAGRAVIVHEKADDFGQPTGNAGSRIGCGVIEVVL